MHVRIGLPRFANGTIAHATVRNAVTTRGAVALLLAAAVTPGQERSIAGCVRDRAGNPIAAATVLLRWRVHPELPGLVGHSLGRQPRNLAESSATGLDELEVPVDAKGRFQLQPPHRGPFELTALASGRRHDSGRDHWLCAAFQHRDRQLRRRGAPRADRPTLLVVAPRLLACC